MIIKKRKKNFRGLLAGQVVEYILLYMVIIGALIAAFFTFQKNLIGKFKSQKDAVINNSAESDDYRSDIAPDVNTVDVTQNPNIEPEYLEENAIDLSEEVADGSDDIKNKMNRASDIEQGISENLQLRSNEANDFNQ